MACRSMLPSVPHGARSWRRPRPSSAPRCCSCAMGTRDCSISTTANPGSVLHRLRNRNLLRSLWYPRSAFHGGWEPEPVEESVVSAVSYPSPLEPEPAEESVEPAVTSRVEPKFIWEAAPDQLPAHASPVQRTTAGRAKVLAASALWITAFILAVVGLVGWSGFAGDVLWLEITWLIGFGFAGVVGAVAAGVSAVRHRILGVLIPLLSYPILFALASVDEGGTWQPGLLSASIALLWWARFTTRSRPADAPRQEPMKSPSDPRSDHPREPH